MGQFRRAAPGLPTTCLGRDQLQMQVRPVPHCALIEQGRPVTLQWPELVQILRIGPCGLAPVSAPLRGPQSYTPTEPTNQRPLVFPLSEIGRGENPPRLYLKQV